MEVDQGKGEGFRSYYIQKIEELQLIVNEKGQNLRRLQAQRNELNAKGKKFPLSSSNNNKNIPLLQFECFGRNFSFSKNKEAMSVK